MISKEKKKGKETKNSQKPIDRYEMKKRAKPKPCIFSEFTAILQDHYPGRTPSTSQTLV
jgi:hypothetical protein